MSACKPHGMMQDYGTCPWCIIAEREAEIDHWTQRWLEEQDDRLALEAYNKRLRGDLEISDLRLKAAWKESDRRGKRLDKLKEGIHEEIWWHLLDEEPPE